MAVPLGADEKSYALLLEPLRHVTTNPEFYAVFFRRTTTQITNPGGLWDDACQIYPRVGGIAKVGPLEFSWPKGGRVKFAHMEHEISKEQWHGSQIALICFDELTHFSQSQFWYMFSRNRSMSGVKGYIRATCNPDADSWVAQFIAWWIDQETGLPIPGRAGVLRWFVRIDNTMFWADSAEELVQRFTGKIAPDALRPKSVTFIPARLTDNQRLMTRDPAYMANLLSMEQVDRERLLHGNWRIRPAAGLYFQRRWLRPIDSVPPDTKWARGWDLAGTPKTEQNNPDWTESVLIGRMPNGAFVVADHTAMRGTADAVDKELLRVARQDQAEWENVQISIPKDPAQSGKAQALSHSRMLLGYNVRFSAESRSLIAPATGAAAKAAKIGRFGPFSAQCEAGNVFYIPGAWNNTWFDRLESFPEAAKDDTADATARAFSVFLDVLPGAEMLELAAREMANMKEQQEVFETVKRAYQPGTVEHFEQQKAAAEAAAS